MTCRRPSIKTFGDQLPVPGEMKIWIQKGPCGTRLLPSSANAWSLDFFVAKKSPGSWKYPLVECEHFEIVSIIFSLRLLDYGRCGRTRSHSRFRPFIDIHWFRWQLKPTWCQFLQSHRSSRSWSLKTGSSMALYTAVFASSETTSRPKSGTGRSTAFTRKGHRPAEKLVRLEEDAPKKVWLERWVSWNTLIILQHG